MPSLRAVVWFKKGKLWQVRPSKAYATFKSPPDPSNNQAQKLGRHFFLKSTTWEAGKAWVEWAELMPSGQLSPYLPPPKTRRGRRKEEQKPSRASRAGRAASALPTSDSSDTEKEQKVGSKGTATSVAFIFAMVFCVVQHWVSVGVKQGTCMPSLPEDSAPSAHLLRDGKSPLRMWPCPQGHLQLFQNTFFTRNTNNCI